MQEQQLFIRQVMIPLCEEYGVECHDALKIYNNAYQEHKSQNGSYKPFFGTELYEGLMRQRFYFQTYRVVDFILGDKQRKQESTTDTSKPSIINQDSLDSKM